jgi:RNA polymerase sigma-70 factor, ECF subfamily
MSSADLQRRAGNLLMADHGARSDESLVEDYLDGDVASFRTLVDRHHDELIRFLRRLMGNAAAAEDVFQETFLQVHQSLETFDTSRRFKPWLFTVAANKGRDALRRANRRRAVSLSAEVRGDSDTSFVDLMAIDIPGPDSRLDAEELSAMVQRAIDQLPPRQREILLLAYFQKMSYAQISDLFDIPLGTVKSRLHAAVASFARHWQSQMEQSKNNGGQGSATAG